MRTANMTFLLALVSSSAMAEWIAVGSNSNETLNVDSETIQWTGNNRAQLWVLNDLKAAQQIDERESFKSEKAKYEYDCKRVQSRLRYFSSYTESMAEGEVVDFLSRRLCCCWKFNCINDGNGRQSGLPTSNPDKSWGPGGSFCASTEAQRAGSGERAGAGVKLKPTG